MSMRYGYYGYETFADAGDRLGMRERDVRKGIANGSLWWVLDRERGKYEVTGAMRKAAGKGAGRLERIVVAAGEVITGRRMFGSVIGWLLWMALFVTVMWPLTIGGLVVLHGERMKSSADE